MAFVIGFVLLSFLTLTQTISIGSGASETINRWIMEGRGGAGLAAIIVVLVILSLWSGGIQSMTVCSRVLFSLARDEALPFSQKWSAVSERFQTPIQAVCLCAGISLAMLVGVKMFHASDIVMDVMSFSIISLHISYMIPIYFKLIRGEKRQLLQDAPRSSIAPNRDD